MKRLMRLQMKFSPLVLLIGAFALLVGSSCYEKDQAENLLPSLTGRKVLMTYGGWAGHDPKVITDTIADWLRAEGAHVIISDDLEVYTNDSLMSSINLIIQNVTMGSISRLQSEGLIAAIKRGAGLAGCHGGIGDSFRDNPDYQFVVGGQWVAHPGGEVDFTVHITNDKDPICAGISDFEIHTEQYYMHIDPNIKVLATTTYSGEHGDWFAGAVMPVVWKKYYGEGRVFYTSLGHARHDFDVPEAWEILTRGIRWASGSRYEPKEDWVEAVYPKGRN
jgi:type 1 glutamine amidotransferase